MMSVISTSTSAAPASVVTRARLSATIPSRSASAATANPSLMKGRAGANGLRPQREDSPASPDQGVSDSSANRCCQRLDTPARAALSQTQPHRVLQVADGLGWFGQSSARGLPDVFRAKAVHGEDLHRDGFGFAEQTTDQVLIWSFPAARASDCATTTVERDPVEPLARLRSGRFADALGRRRFCGACLLSLMFAPMSVHGALPRRRPSTSSG